MFDETTDDDVLAHYAAQQADAFAILYRRHIQRVYSYLRSRVGNVQDAQDLTAQTFLAALEHIQHYRSQDQFIAWLLGIARHKAVDHYRQSAPTSALATLEDQIVRDNLPEQWVEQQLAMETVATALNLLNPERAEALRLRVFGDLKMSEVAAMMGKSEGAVKMLVARALSDLRQLLQAEKEKLHD